MLLPCTVLVAVGGVQVVTIADYDLYCHYVAGLVGIGLSQLFGEQAGPAAAATCAANHPHLSLHTRTDPIAFSCMGSSG